MRLPALVTVPVLVAVALSAAVLPEATAQTFTSPSFGFSIRPPRDWEEQIQNASSWIPAIFRSTRFTVQLDEEKYSWRHYPELTLVAFASNAATGESREDGQQPGAQGDQVVYSPYRDYRDYLKRAFVDGGYYFSLEEEDEHDGLPVSRYEVKIEKLTMTGPRRLVTWVYHLADLSIGAQFEIQENSYDKLRGDMLRCFKSFKEVERTEPLPTDTGGLHVGGGATIRSGDLSIPRSEWNRLTLGERNDLRKDMEQKAHQKAIDELPKGWRSFHVGRTLVLDNHDPKLAKDIAQHCEAIIKWLDDSFYFIGPGEYVRAPILRVYRRENDDGIILRGSISTGVLDNIVIDYEHDPNWVGIFDYGYETVNRQVMELWFNDRDWELKLAMPYWVEYGLDDLIENSRPKGSRVDFYQLPYDHTRLRLANARGELSSAKDLILMGQEAFLGGRFKKDEASALVRFLLVGPGSKSRKTKDVFFTYLQNLQHVTDEIRKEEHAAKEAAKDAAKPTTEEEEDAYFKERQTAWKEKEERVLNGVFDRTFSGFTDRDWESFEKAYLRSIED